MRPDIAVETLIIHPHQLVPNLYRLPVKPAVETVSNLLYLGGCLLYGFLVRYTHLITIAVYLFRDFRYSIMQGMNKQIPTVIVTNEIGVVSHRRVTLQTYYVGVVHIEIHYACLGLEKFSCKIGI